MRIDVRPLCALLVLTLFVLAATGAHAEEIERAPEKTPILHVAVGPHGTLFIHGTLHIPDTRIAVLTEVEKAAVKAADELWTEVDFSNDVRVQLMPYVRLPKNRNLGQLMGDRLSARVAAILKRRGERLSTWQGLKPWMLDIYIGLLFAPTETATEQTIDQALFEEAKAAKKVVGGLESVYEQVSVFDRLSLKEQVKLLEQTVDRLEKDVRRGTNSVETMIRIYLSGDAEELLTEVETYFDFNTKRDRDLYHLMHGKRNRRFVERLETKAKKDGGKMRFVALGAAHLPGKQGVLRLLEQAGYVTWRVKSLEDIPATREASMARGLAELQRKNAAMGFALRSLEQKVDRLQERMDKNESRSPAKAGRRGCPPVPKRRACRRSPLMRCCCRPRKTYQWNCKTRSLQARVRTSQGRLRHDAPDA